MTRRKDYFTYCFKKGVNFDPSHIGVGSEKEEVKDGGVVRKNCVTMSSTACTL
jgi:hypothetical protein